MDDVYETFTTAVLQVTYTVEHNIFTMNHPLSDPMENHYSGVIICDCRAAEALEREKLLASGSISDITPHDLLQPQSDFHIRNRYLSRIGALVRLIYFKK
jgi:hypothetical protein